MPGIIKTKQCMYSLLSRGLLGNTVKIYNTIDEIPNGELVSVRYSKIGSMGRCIYGIEKSKLHTIDLTDAVISEYPQSKSTVVLNGELTEIEYGYYLRYKLGNMVMRQAMKQPNVVVGYKAKLLLRHYMDQSGLDTIEELLNTYRDHVIEFTVFSKPLGMMNSNTIIWEVRLY